MTDGWDWFRSETCVHNPTQDHYLGEIHGFYTDTAKAYQQRELV